MESKSKLDDIIKEIIPLLEFSEEDFWVSYFKNIQQQLAIIENEENACDSILNAFQGGMGSLNDLVLHKNGKPLVNENNKMDKLKDKLFDYCMEIKNK
jgi:hypothetical protein